METHTSNIIILSTIIPVFMGFIIWGLVSEYRDRMKVKKYIKEGGLIQPKVEITEIGLSKFKVSVLGLDFFMRKLETRTLKDHLIFDRSDVYDEFMRIAKLYNLHKMIGVGYLSYSDFIYFKSLEEAKLAVKCLYEALELIKGSDSSTVVVKDYRDEYNEAKTEEFIQKNMDNLTEYKKQKEDA